MKIKSPVLVATLTISAAALALATRKPVEQVPSDNNTTQNVTEQEPWFI